MKEPKDMVLPMLKEMRPDIAALRARMDERFDENDKPHKSFTHALSADTLMGRLLAGEFEERIEKLEKYGERIEKLESKIRAFEGRS
jgi:uncharacterized small protein (DUF1192 family)